MIKVISAETNQIDVNIKTAVGTISTGYALTVTLQNGERRVTIDALNLLVTGEQNRHWCVDQCEQLKIRLMQQPTYSPGQIMRLLKCGYQPIADLGFPTPPQQHYAARTEYRKFNDLYGKWATAYNAWIDIHPELASDYGCSKQDPNWKPIK